MLLFYHNPVHRAVAVAVLGLLVLLLLLMVLQVIGQGRVQFTVVAVVEAVLIKPLLRQRLIPAVVPFMAVAAGVVLTHKVLQEMVEPLFGVAQVLREQLGLRLLPMVLNPEAVQGEQKAETQATGVMAELGLLIGKNI
jgi:hypothetical protein